MPNDLSARLRIEIEAVESAIILADWNDTKHMARAAIAALDAVRGWQPIETCPHDQTVILANFTNQCLLTGAPHVWTATYVTKWESLDGTQHKTTEPRMCECSFAAMNKNGEPTHWQPLPTPPEDKP